MKIRHFQFVIVQLIHAGKQGFCARSTCTLYSGVKLGGLGLAPPRNVLIFCVLKDDFVHLEGTMFVFTDVAPSQIWVLLWNSIVSNQRMLLILSNSAYAKTFPEWQIRIFRQNFKKRKISTITRSNYISTVYI